MPAVFLNIASDYYGPGRETKPRELESRDVDDMGMEGQDALSRRVTSCCSGPLRQGNISHIQMSASIREREQHRRKTLDILRTPP
jgi:hypothetical protein